MNRIRLAPLALLILTVLTGCASTMPHNPVPEDRVGQATVAGLKGLRYWGDARPENFEELAAERIAHLNERFCGPEQEDQTPTLTFLALSGGGAKGAFGAGLLKGWTETGTRPEFEVVTGVSTGALMAPFAFLGPEFDAFLEQAYLKVTPEQIFRSRKWSAITGGAALADTAPLARLLEQSYDQELLDRIAREYRRGRLLFIGTSHLDAKRLVLWDIGYLAASGHPDSLNLLRKIMLASAAVPGFFPPVQFEVEVGSETYDELHVDGGITSNVFFYPAQVSPGKHIEQLDCEIDQQLYVIRNGKVDPEYDAVKKVDAVSIGLRAIGAMGNTQNVGDLHRLYVVAQRDDLGIHLAWAPKDLPLPPATGFDPAYQKEMFDRGYQMALDGTVWHDKPPGLE